jgi:glycosyltransferase involved in cell wall biosynthesis
VQGKQRFFPDCRAYFSALTIVKSVIRLHVDLERIGIIIPAFNAEKTIGPLISALKEKGFSLKNIIVIDDGSTDRTGEIVKGTGVTIITHKANIGKGAALKHGFEMARKIFLEKVFTIDADGQHRVTDIEDFMRCKDDYDIIVGCRHDVKHMPRLRQLVNRVTSLVASLLAGYYLTDVQCGFRLIDLGLFKRLRLKTNNYQTESEMIIKTLRLEKRIGSLPITTVYNNERSYINPIMDTLRFIKMAVEFLWR